MLSKIIKAVFNKETILYVFFGALTTAVNLTVFWLCETVFGWSVHPTNITAWIASVVFAYITNKLFVFESKSWNFDVLKKEIPTFIGARIFSLGIEEGGILLFINLLHLDAKISVPFISGVMVIKLCLQVLVVIANYIFSKLVIFKKNPQ